MPCLSAPRAGLPFPAFPPQVKAIFGTGKKKVAGCYVESGKLSKGAMIEVVRGSGKDKTVVYTGKLASLRRIKDTVEEVRHEHTAALHWQQWIVQLMQYAQHMQLAGGRTA